MPTRTFADLAAEPFDFLVRQLQKLVEQPELVHQFERRGMNGVAAKVAEEIRVLFQNDNVDAGARQQKSQHDAGRPAAGNAAGGRDGRRGHDDLRN